jgi:hypothetical protein
MEYNKIHEDFEENFELRATSRKQLRDTAVQKFLSEKGGYVEGKDKHITRYKYFVEKLNDGRRVYLIRPTFLNKGIDFQVWVEKMDGDKDKRPSHKDVFADLKLKKAENSGEVARLLTAIDRVGNCEEPDTVLRDMKFSFKKGFSVELLLKILKWLFIEQDITYWNYDGRGMLREAINENVK